MRLQNTKKGIEHLSVFNIKTETEIDQQKFITFLRDRTNILYPFQKSKICFLCFYNFASRKTTKNVIASA